MRSDIDLNVCWEKMQTFPQKYSFSDEEHLWLFELMKEHCPDNPVILELGICNGRTACLLSYFAGQLGGEYHGVDIFSLESNAEQFEKRMKAAGLDYNLYVFLTNEVDWKKPVDILLIDAAHNEPFVSQDCEKYLPFVKPGGLVIFDDCPPTVDQRVINHKTGEVIEYSEFQSRMARGGVDDLLQDIVKFADIFDPSAQWTGRVPFEESRLEMPWAYYSPHWAIRYNADKHTGDWEQVCYNERQLVKRRPKS